MNKTEQDRLIAEANILLDRIEANLRFIVESIQERKNGFR